MPGGDGAWRREAALRRWGAGREAMASRFEMRYELVQASCA